jgi:hypothetical protein
MRPCQKTNKQKLLSVALGKIEEKPISTRQWPFWAWVNSVTEQVRAWPLTSDRHGLEFQSLWHEEASLFQICPGVRLHGFRSQFCSSYLHDLERCLVSLCLSFLIFRMQLIRVLTPRVIVLNEKLSTWLVPGMQWSVGFNSCHCCTVCACTLIIDSYLTLSPRQIWNCFHFHFITSLLESQLAVICPN